VTDDSTSIPEMPRRDQFATVEEFQESFAEWQAAATQAEEAGEHAAWQQLEAWRIDHMDASESWDRVAAGARQSAGLGLPVVVLPGLDDQNSCCCTNPRWRQDPRGSCPSPGRHPDFGYRARAEYDPPFAAALFPPDTKIVDTETAPVSGVGAVLFAGEYIEIDVDRHGTDGFATLARLEEQLGDLPATLTVGTPRDGEHRIYIDPRRDDPELYFRAGAVDTGIDLVGNGQVTPMPPTRTPAGSYVMLDGRVPARLPHSWVEFLRREPPPVRVAGQRGEIPESALPRLRSWIISAVASEADRLAQVTSGRNVALNLAAFRLGQIAAAAEDYGFPESLPEDVAYGHLMGACDANRYIAEKSLARAAATFRSGWNGGLREPRQDLPASLFDPRPSRTRDDFGLSDRLVDQEGHRIRWVEQMDKWLIYNGGRWGPERVRVVQGLARDVIERIPLEAAPEELALALNEQDGDGDDRGRGDLLRWAMKQRSAASITRMLNVAKGEPELQASTDDFDGDPWLFNCADSVIDLRSGQKLAHDPDQLMMLQSPIRYDPAARAPQWVTFLERTQPDPEMRAYLQRVIGYSLTGLIIEQAVFLHHGLGANGKSVCMEVLSHILGDYAQVVPVATLIRKKMDGGIPNDVARMRGRRFLQTAETASGQQMDEEIVKSLTGGEKVTARFMRAEFFDFKPTGKIHLATNHLPQLSNAESIWRRLHLVPWSVVIPQEERDRELSGRLMREEAEGILNWCVQGTLLWQEAGGLRMPETAHSALAEYREDQDTLGQFINSSLREDPDAWISNADLYQAYQIWASMAGHSPLSQKRLNQDLKERGYVVRRAGHEGSRGFAGITLSNRVPGPTA
jgi:putative DNA primase/helicase